MRRPGNLLAYAAIILTLVSCRQASFYGALGDKISSHALAIAPTAASLALGNSITFSATGGTTPYAFSVASGTGTINSSTGAFIASMVGAVVVRVTDKNGSTADAPVAVSPTGALSLNPTGATVGTNASIQFVAAGGTPPYTFSFGSTTSSPTMNLSTGLYTSGFTTGGFDQVRVSDAAVPAASVTATVNVTPTVSNVDYTISAGSSYPTAGTGGKMLPGSDFFIIQNVGSVGGSQTINWWVYVSDSTTLNAAGTVMLAQGTTPKLGVGGTATININGTWPVVPVPAGATKYLFVMIQADDDLNSTNNVTSAHAVALTPPRVNYTESGFGAVTARVAGAPFSSSFTLQNLGTDSGVQAVSWTVYVSLDSSVTIDAGAKVIDSGTTSALGPSPAFRVINFSGAWPATPGGPYFLKVTTSSPEDTDTTNNVAVSGGTTTTYVNYTVTTISDPPGTVAGQTLSSSFDLQNTGTGDGTQPVIWTAYVSPSQTLVAGDAVLASGSTPLLTSMNTRTISFSSLWPPTTGTWYLIVTVNAPDDSVSTDNLVATTKTFTTTPAQPDYTMISVTNNGSAPWVPGASVPFTFQFQNTSLQNGTQPLSWTVYASTKNTLDGSAIQVASGTTQPLLAGNSTSISSSGPWPLHYGYYYLLASISVAEDVGPGTNWAATGTTTPVGIYSETEQNGDLTGLSNYNNFGVVNGIVLKPGMSILINGSLPNPVNNTDLDDIFAFNTGGVSSINFYMAWTGIFDAGLFPMTAANTYALGLQIQNANTLSLGWIPDTQNVQRWIDVQDGVLITPPSSSTYGKMNIGPYTLVISAN